MNKETYYQKCINRIYKEGNEIKHRYALKRFEVDGLGISTHCFRGNTTYYVEFNGAAVPLTYEERKELFDKVKREYLNRKERQDAKILEQL